MIVEEMPAGAQCRRVELQVGRRARGHALAFGAERRLEALAALRKPPALAPIENAAVRAEAGVEHQVHDARGQQRDDEPEPPERRGRRAFAQCLVPDLVRVVRRGGVAVEVNAEHEPQQACRRYDGQDDDPTGPET
jgi:hypothetical protein